jgi:hypothetical protein
MMTYYRRSTNRVPRPARWMELRYPGHCKVCDETIPKGRVAFYDPEGRTVTCRTIPCATADNLTTEQAVWPSGTQTVYLNHRIGAPAASRNGRVTVGRGRCEDAPCCGCCDV